MLVDRFDDACCGVCASSATGFGYAPRPSRDQPFRPLWCCDDPECLPIARNTYAMRQDDFSRVEEMAADEALHALEQYCESISKSDFRTFTAEEASAAVRAAIAEYRGALKNKLRDESPF